MKIQFAENFKRLRKENNYTQENIAEILGVSFQSVSKWEREECLPDITLLPAISSLFNVSVDELLGNNKIKNEEQIQALIKSFDEFYMVDTPKCLSLMQKAIRKFPGEYRLLVRYLSVLIHEKGNMKSAEDISDDVQSIFDKIEKYCTDDSIRIWAKRLVINYYTMRNDDKYQLKAEKIAMTMPEMSDSKEYISTYLYRPFGNGKDPFYKTVKKHTDACQNAIEEALFMLESSVISYCLYDDSFTPDEKIEALEILTTLNKQFYTDDYYGKNALNIVYNYGSLSWLYFLKNDEENALKNLKICASEAKKFDEAPDEFTSKALFFNGKKLEKPKRGKTCTERMKLYFLNQYPFSEEFKNKKEFRDIINNL